MAFIWGGLDFYKAGGLLRERGKYTIGYVRGTHWAVKSGKQVDFYITVNGQTYRGGADELPGMKIKGGRYLVKYDSLDLQTKGVYYQYAIPDSIGEAPANGWRASLSGACRGHQPAGDTESLRYISRRVRPVVGAASVVAYRPRSCKKNSEPVCCEAG